MLRALGLLIVCAAAGGCILEDPHSGGMREEEGVAMVYVPTQCATNPWQESHEDVAIERTSQEAEKIRAHYAGLGVTLANISFETVYEAVCEACSCPRGDWIHADVDPDDAARAEELGWNRKASMTRPAA